MIMMVGIKDRDKLAVMRGREGDGGKGEGEGEGRATEGETLAGYIVGGVLGGRWMSLRLLLALFLLP